MSQAGSFSPGGGGGGGLTWNSVSGPSQAIAVGNGYVNKNAGLTTFTLPVTAAFGSQFAIAGYGAGGWIIDQNAGQKVYFGSTTSTAGAGGTVASTNAHDSVFILCVVANTEFQILNSIGNLGIV